MAASTRGPLLVALRQASLLAVIAIVAAALAWAVRSDRLPLRADPEVYALDLPVPLVTVAVAQEHYAAGDHYFFDTRAGDPAGRTGIPGAFVIREATFAADLEAAMDFIYPEDRLVLYGDRSPLPVAAVAARFLERGYPNLLILQGGLEAWRRAGAPLADGGVQP